MVWLSRSVRGVDAGGYAERTARLFRVAGLLKQYADQYKLAVVVTNQVITLRPHGPICYSPYTILAVYTM